MTFEHTPSACCAHHSPVVERDAHGHTCSSAPHSHPAPHTHSVDGVEAHRPRQRRALAISMILTVVTMVIEAVAGVLTGSLMLLSDSVHMLSHTVSLGVSWIAIRIASRPRTSRSHYGLFRAEILASLFNAIGLFVLTGWIVWEAVERLQDPIPIDGPEMIAVAILGLVVNILTAFILGRSGAEDLNTKSALLHMLGDLFSSVVIVIGGVVLMQTGWSWIDPVLSLAVALVILWWGYGLLRSSCSILLERSPEGVAPEEVEELLRAEPGVHDVHDLHIWEITSGYVCLTAHVVVAGDTSVSQTSSLRESICARLWESFRVAHVTLQLETD
ncbi:MAG TPA: cation transporter [Planctomycetes bacterium]|nr:cation transporter [Planctomycetota bacterium]